MTSTQLTWGHDNKERHLHLCKMCTAGSRKSYNFRENWKHVLIQHQLSNTELTSGIQGAKTERSNT